MLPSGVTTWARTPGLAGTRSASVIDGSITWTDFVKRALLNERAISEAPSRQNFAAMWRKPA